MFLSDTDDDDDNNDDDVVVGGGGLMFDVSDSSILVIARLWKDDCAMKCRTVMC